MSDETLGWIIYTISAMWFASLCWWLGCTIGAPTNIAPELWALCGFVAWTIAAAAIRFWFR